MANVVTNLVKASPEMFPVDQAISFSTNLTKLMKSAGRNDAEIASIMDGMNKSFQKGAVDTETLNKMKSSPPSPRFTSLFTAPVLRPKGVVKRLVF